MLATCLSPGIFFTGECNAAAPVLGCDGVIYPNYCQMQVFGHEADDPVTVPHPGRLPDTCADTAQGTKAQFQAYVYCNYTTPVACRTLANGFQQVVCAQTP
jgi:hypothetical protein